MRYVLPVLLLSSPAPNCGGPAPGQGARCVLLVERTPPPGEAFGGLTVGEVVTAASGDHSGALRYTDGRCSAFVVHIETADPVLRHSECQIDGKPVRCASGDGGPACPDELRIPATMRFSSADGAFDETRERVDIYLGPEGPPRFLTNFDASNLGGTFQVAASYVYIAGEIQGGTISGTLTAASNYPGGTTVATYAAPDTCP